ncbi:MAG: hypothetical protein PHV85_00510 [Desulfovibrionaceae bacterium]|nr:hypothetical protein [Desulfovibrionaceae bacterium]
MAKIPGEEQLGGIGAAQISGTAMPYMSGPAQQSLLAGAGKAGAGLADLLGAFSEAERETRWSTIKTDTYTKLLELSSAVEAERDPEAVRTTWENGLKAIEDQNKNLSDDPGLKSAWDEYYGQTKARLQVGVNRVHRQRIVDQGQAALHTNLGSLVRALDHAKSPEEVEEIKKTGLAEIERKAQAGILPATTISNFKESFLNTLDREADKRTEQERYQGVYAGLRAQFPNPADAAEHLEDPANQQALGLNLKESLWLINEFEAQGANDERKRRQAEEAGVKREREQVYNQIRQGDITGAMNSLKGSRFLPAEDALKIEDALKKAAWKDDPDLVARLKTEVWGRRITKPDELTAHLGHGLSLETLEDLRGDVDKLADVPKGAVNYFDLAVNRFRKRFKDEPAILEHEAKFVTSLAYMAKERGLRPIDPAIDKLSDEILGPSAIEDHYIGLFDKDYDSKFEQWFDTGEFPWMSAPTPNVIRQVPPALVGKIRQTLDAAGKDTSDASVYRTWLANRDKLEKTGR